MVVAQLVAGGGFREDSAVEGSLGWGGSGVCTGQSGGWACWAGNSLSKNLCGRESIGQPWEPGRSTQHLEHGQV